MQLLSHYAVPYRNEDPSLPVGSLNTLRMAGLRDDLRVPRFKLLEHPG